MHLCPEPYVVACVYPLAVHKRASTRCWLLCARSLARSRARACARAPPTPSTHTSMSNAGGFFSPFGVSIIPAARARARDCLAAWKSRGTPRSRGSLPRDTPGQQCTDPRLMHPRRSRSLKY